jgi:amidase
VTDLNRLSATAALAGIRAGKMSAEAYVRACLERIAARDPHLHAFVCIDAEHALARARVIDRTSSQSLLGGLPFAVKDVIDTADLPTRYNSPIYDDHRPRMDAACVALARLAGGVMIGKTVTTEFASRMPGPTVNPHDAAHTPGGSSSGSAAAVADGMVPFAFGTQTGGSVIRPAAFCGAVGYKPSFGTINCTGMKHLAESLDTIGVIARTVTDCALLVHAVSGRTAADLTASAAPPRIGFTRTSRWQRASAATHAVLERAAATFTKRGAAVMEMELPADFDRLYDEQTVISGFEAARAMMPEYLAQPALLSEHMRNQVERYIALPRREYADAIRHAIACRRRFSELMAEAKVDLLLTPSAPDEAPLGIASTGDSLFNRNWTLLGLPCITLPAGKGAAGLPIGVQLVADYDEDERLLRSAQWAFDALA